ncbi:MAG TPA: T9SS type A sorting domain-containing protein [Bacteroidia bacterium]|jgi:hypothetical protein|nr:T9SS type A sorting domain-containing protein [Bacteroidia bacterium]
MKKNLKKLFIVNALILLALHAKCQQVLSMHDYCLSTFNHISPPSTETAHLDATAISSGNYYPVISVISNSGSSFNTLGQNSDFDHIQVWVSFTGFAGYSSWCTVGVPNANSHITGGGNKLFFDPSEGNVLLSIDATTTAGSVAGHYVQLRLTLYDVGGNEVDHADFKVRISAPISAPSPIKYCIAKNPFTLSVNNDPDYNYSWFLSDQFGAEIGPSIGSGPSITLTPPIQYAPIWVEASNVNTKCSSPPAKIVLIQSPIAGSISIFTKPTTYCSGQSSLFTITGANSYYVVNNHDNTVVNGSGPSVVVTMPYVTVQTPVTYTVYSSLPDCENPATIVLNVLPYTDFLVNSTPNPSCPNQPINLNAQSTSGNLDFNWSGPGLNYSCTSVINCNTTVSPAATTLYTVTGINSFGCPLTKSITANVLPSAQIGLGSNPSSAIQVPSFNLCQLNTSFSTYFSSINTANTYAWSISPNDGNITFSGGNNNSQTIALLANNPNKNQTYVLTLTTTQTLPGGASVTICTTTNSIQIKPCCNTFSNSGYTVIGNGTGQSTLSGLPNGNYIVTGQIDVGNAGVINPLTSFSGSNFIMNPGSQIVLEDNLSLTNCHLYGCNDMWEGIAFAGDNIGVNTNPSLTINNSLIEDAKYGINAVDPINVPTPASNPSITLNKVWFNRCAVGIANDFDPFAFPVNSYSGNLQINNSVFTCRNNVTMAMVQSTITPKGNTGALSGLPTAYLHNFNYKSKYYSFTGIAAGLLAYQGGSGAPRLIKNCFFDWQMDGILSGGDLTVQKCTFQDMLLIQPSDNETDVNNHLYGSAIAPYYNPKVGSGINFYGSSLTVGGGGSNANNFNICRYGIIAEPDGGSAVNITGNSFNLTTYSGVFYTSVGNSSGQALQNVSISNNNFSDHFYQGVNAFFVPASGQHLDISGNNFNISNGFYSFFNPTYTNLPEAIFASSLPHNFGGGPNNAHINILGNTITNYQLGITALTAIGSNIINNTISMYEDNNISVNNFTHGISATHCDGSTISQNDISSINTVNAWKYGQFGIITENGINSIVSCNRINHVDVALKCQGSQNTSSIVENTLQDAAIVSFWLDNAGFVGPQGHGGFPGFTNANKFINVGQYAMYANNSTNGTLSPFYYVNVGNNRPIPSVSDFPATPSTAIPIGAPYALTPFAFSPRPCPIINLLGPGQPPVLSNGIAQQIATNSLQFAQFNTTASFGNKLDLYRTLIGAGSASYSGDATLTTFMGSMSGTSHAQLVATDTLFGNAGSDSAKINIALSINNTFAPTDKYDTYMQKINNLYGSFVKQRRHLNNSEVQQVRNIAQLCPYEYGEGVYRARSLLSRFDTLRYLNICEKNSSIPSLASRTASQNIEAESTTAQNGLIIYPNPASSSLFIEGLQAGENDKTEFVVYNSLGEMVLKTVLVGNQSSAQNVDITRLANGTYMYKVIVNGATIHFDKLIILN